MGYCRLIMAIQDRTAAVDPGRISRDPLPGSRKVHVEGSLPGVRVPMREVASRRRRAPGRAAGARRAIAPFVLYDTSGPFTDPDVAIDLRRGLAPLRLDWIDGARRHRASDGASLARSRAPATATRASPRCASAHARPCCAQSPAGASPRCTTPGAARSRRRWSSSRSARASARSSGLQARPPGPLAPHPRRELRRRPAGADHAGVRARRGRARPRDHPRQHQPSRARADGDRPQLPGQDQREHRQQRGHVARSRRKSRSWCGRCAGAPTP